MNQDSPDKRIYEFSDREIKQRRRLSVASHQLSERMTTDDRDKQGKDYSLFDLTEEQRRYVLNNVQNPFKYPINYFNIYQRERQLRRPFGYTNCANITKMKIFSKMTMFSQQKYISNYDNYNVIKTKDIKEMEKEFNFYGRNITNDVDQIQSLQNIIELMKMYYNYFGIIPTLILEPFSDEKLFELAILINNTFFNGTLGLIRNNEFKKQFVKIYEQGPFMDHNIFIYRFVFTIFDEFKDNIVIAGGSALSLYTHLNYGYKTEFSDFDIFIHSVSEEGARDIIRRIASKFRMVGNPFNSNVISFELENSPYEHICLYHEGGEEIFLSKINFQIIKRVYFSPSEVIHGFDIDSSCVLVNSNLEIYGTQRFINAVMNGYNVVNFDRLSPSYSHRLSKFYKRGFAIWIPEIEYVVRNIILDSKFIGNRHLGTILRNITLSGRQSKENEVELSDYNIYTKNNYWYNDDGSLIDINQIEFITIDPGQQISNTFNKEVLEDQKVWYTSFYKNLDKLQLVNLNEIELENDELIEFDTTQLYDDKFYYSPYVHIKNNNYKYYNTKFRNIYIDILKRYTQQIKGVIFNKDVLFPIKNYFTTFYSNLSYVVSQNNPYNLNINVYLKGRTFYQSFEEISQSSYQLFITSTKYQSIQDYIMKIKNNIVQFLDIDYPKIKDINKIQDERFISLRQQINLMRTLIFENFDQLFDIEYDSDFSKIFNNYGNNDDPDIVKFRMYNLRLKLIPSNKCIELIKLYIRNFFEMIALFLNIQYGTIINLNDKLIDDFYQQYSKFDLYRLSNQVHINFIKSNEHLNDSELLIDEGKLMIKKSSFQCFKFSGSFKYDSLAKLPYEVYENYFNCRK